MSKIILLNGPIECGKNTAVDHLNRVLSSPLVDRRCKDHLFTLTQNFFCVSEEQFFSIYEDRTVKEEPCSLFMISMEQFLELRKVTGNTIKDRWLENTTSGHNISISVREALIFVSEVICKPTFGKDYFGVARAKSIPEGEFCVDDSCGFDEEIAPTLTKLGVDNTLLIRVKGRGTYCGDSRSFISDGVVPLTIDVDNSSTEKDFLDSVEKIVRNFLNED